MKDYLIENCKETNTEWNLNGIGVSDFGNYYDLIKGQIINDAHLLTFLLGEFKE